MRTAFSSITHVGVDCRVDRDMSVDLSGAFHPSSPLREADEVEIRIKTPDGIRTEPLPN